MLFLQQKVKEQNIVTINNVYSKTFYFMKSFIYVTILTTLKTRRYEFITWVVLRL